MSVRFQKNGVRTISFTLPESNIAAIIRHWKEFVDDIPPYPSDFKGRGIVICAGGKSYFTCCWILINTLRNELKCDLPIQVWYKGDEITPELVGALSAFRVTCHNLEDYYEPGSNVSGYAMKPLSILFSSFKEVLYLDADNICTLNPDLLFDLPEYNKFGALFWPDFWTTDSYNQIWKIVGIPPSNEKEQESGQILINKERCWAELNLAVYFNVNSHIYYKYLVGDKDTFRFAWRALGKEFYYIKHEVASGGYMDVNGHFIGHTMVQHVPDGRAIFLHRNLLKWDKTDTQVSTWEKIKKFNAEATKKEYVLYWDFNKKQNVIDLEGDVEVFDFRDLFQDLEKCCLTYLQSLREEEFYKRL